METHATRFICIVNFFMLLSLQITLYSSFHTQILDNLFLPIYNLKRKSENDWSIYPFPDLRFQVF